MLDKFFTTKYRRTIAGPLNIKICKICKEEFAAFNDPRIAMKNHLAAKHKIIAKFV